MHMSPNATGQQNVLHFFTFCNITTGRVAKCNISNNTHNPQLLQRSVSRYRLVFRIRTACSTVSTSPRTSHFNSFKKASFRFNCWKMMNGNKVWIHPVTVIITCQKNSPSSLRSCRNSSDSPRLRLGNWQSSNTLNRWFFVKTSRKS